MITLNDEFKSQQYHFEFDILYLKKVFFFFYKTSHKINVNKSLIIIILTSEKLQKLKSLEERKKFVLCNLYEKLSLHSCVLTNNNVLI